MTSAGSSDKTAPPGVQEVHSFILLVRGFEVVTPELVDQLFIAGCDDAIAGVSSGTSYVAFDRKAESIDYAIRSAIRDVERCGAKIEVLGVRLPGAEFMDDINSLLRTREKIKSQFQGRLPNQTFEKLMDTFNAALESGPEAVRHLTDVLKGGD
jgi:hypothetical protein